MEKKITNFANGPGASRLTRDEMCPRQNGKVRIGDGHGKSRPAQDREIQHIITNEADLIACQIELPKEALKNHPFLFAALIHVTDSKAFEAQSDCG